MSASTCLPFSLFREQANQELCDIVSRLPAGDSKPFLAFAPSIANYCARLITGDTLKTRFRGACSLSDTSETKNDGAIVVIAPSDRGAVSEICDIFRRIPNYLKVLLLIPRNTALTQQAIEESGFRCAQGAPRDLTREIAVHEFHADFLSLDEDFFVLPCHRTFYQVEVENDFNDLYSAARALAKIQSVFGTIPQVLTLGSSSGRVRQLMNGILDQARLSKTSLPQIDTLVLIDRKADLVTPFSTQMPFESFVDELFGIDYGIVSYGGKQIVFSDKTPFFKEILSLSINDFGNYIDTAIDEIKQANSRRTEMKNLTGQEFKKAYLRMQQISSEEYQNNLKMAFDICNDIIKGEKERHPALNVLLTRELELMMNQRQLVDIIEKYAMLMGDWETALRLICLQSAAGKTFKKNVIEAIEKEVFAEFGVEACESLITLEKLRLLSTEEYVNFAQLTKQLSLFESTDAEGDNELLKVCCKSVPLSVRIVQRAATNDWTGKWSKAFEDKGMQVEKHGEAPRNTNDDEVRYIMVFFVGGVTLSEVLYIRELEKLVFHGKVKFIIGGTDIVNNNKMMQQLCPFLSK